MEFRYSSRMKRAFALVFAMSCGGGDSANVDAGPSDASVDTTGLDSTLPVTVVLTSPTLVEAAAFDVANTCDGTNTSPQLDWTGTPSNALSFAVVLTDKSNSLIHSVIYDIPSTRTGLPADVDKAFEPADVPGAHQTRTLGGAGNRGYSGPCPPAQDGPHTYEFAVFALDAATLPGASMATNQEQAKALILAHVLASGLLTGTRDR